MAPEATTPPKASSLPASLDSLGVEPSSKQFSADEVTIDSLIRFQRAANYLSVAQIFLTRAPGLFADKSVKDDLKQDEVKKRLLGHFGTCPGLNLVTAHLNELIKRHHQKSILVVGPGHGAPSTLSTLYLEGSITRFYPEYTMDKEGLDKFVKAFSWPGGFPSHVNAETPGAIHEGGELGYALSVSYGAAMDNPDLLVTCVIGDGEAETGPTGTAWHAHKFLDPAESGAVLPILHVNGFKISERTLFGTMDNREAIALFSGYGYQCCIVEYEHPEDPSHESDRKMQQDMYAAMEWAYSEIKKIQKAARSGKPLVKPRWPMLFMRSPKGWTGPKTVNNMPMVNSFRSHQVPLPKSASDEKEFGMLQDWLQSYGPAELFDPKGKSIVRPETIECVPDGDTGELKLGLLSDVWRGYKALDLPADWRKYATKKDEKASEMQVAATYLSDVIKRNPHTFRIFSPDELASNKLNGVFDVTHRNFQWDPETANAGGRVIEMLSEHTLQGFLQGYTLTGRIGLFPSYEAFLNIVVSMCEQYAKFVKVALETNWRGPVASINYIETSTLWRQEHNGFSHQAPGFINTMLVLPAGMARIYLPPDASTFVSCLDHCLRSQNYVNLLIGAKHPTTVWLTPDEAEAHCVAGGGVWPKYSTHDGENPDVTLVGIGVEMTEEVVHAAAMLQKDAPKLRIRVVNICDLMILGEHGHPHALTNTAFDSLFTRDKPVVIAFHGYPAAVQSLIFSRDQSLTRSRFYVRGYAEVGTTTTPFSMLRVNGVSRFDLAALAVKAVAAYDSNGPLATTSHQLISMYQHRLREHEKYTLIHGEDPPELSQPPLFEQ